jgi:hypothetical protein
MDATTAGDDEIEQPAEFVMRRILQDLEPQGKALSTILLRRDLASVDQRVRELTSRPMQHAPPLFNLRK